MVDTPYFRGGGMVVLYGNIAPKVAVVKQSTVKESIRPPKFMERYRRMVSYASEGEILK